MLPGLKGVATFSCHCHPKQARPKRPNELRGNRVPGILWEFAVIRHRFARVKKACPVRAGTASRTAE